MIQIKRGTRSDYSERLCDSCENGRVMRGAGESQEVVMCHYGNPAKTVPFKVVECSGYERKGTVSLYMMQAMAWTVKNDKKKGVIGFVSPDERRAKNDGMDYEIQES